MKTLESRNGTTKEDTVIKIGRRGKRKFQFDEGDPIFTVDVIEVYNDFVKLDRSFRNEAGEFDASRETEYGRAKWGFVIDLIKQLIEEQASPGQEDAAKVEAEVAGNECSEADALYFIKLIQDEANDLIPFFRLKSAAKPSSQESSPTVGYSE